MPPRVATLRPVLVSLPVGFLAAVKLEKAVGAQAATTLVSSRMGAQAERSWGTSRVQAMKSLLIWYEALSTQWVREPLSKVIGRVTASNALAMVLMVVASSPSGRRGVSMPATWKGRAVRSLKARKFPKGPRQKRAWLLLRPSSVGMASSIKLATREKPLRWVAWVLAALLNSLKRCRTRLPSDPLSHAPL